MNPNEIWRPDIVLINSADQQNLLNIFTDSELVVNSTGDVTWITMGLLHSKCPIWFYEYPFIVRPVTCRLSFCSLIYQSHEVNITTPGNEFFLAGPWFINPRLQMINITGERYEKYYEGYGTYSFESLQVQLKRRENSLPLIIRIPIMTSIAIVLCMFFLPVTWPVRIHLAMFAMFIQLTLILYIGLQLGPNAIGLARPISYLRDDLFLSALALLLTLVFRRFLALADYMPQLPYGLSNLLDGPIAKLLCFGINESEYKQHTSSFTQLASQPTSSSSNLRPSAAKFVPTCLQPSRLARNEGPFAVDHVALINDDANQDNEQESNCAGSPMQNSTSIKIGDQSSNVSLGSRRYESSPISSSQREWMLMVIFCDRLLFAFYALLMVPRLV